MHLVLTGVKRTDRHLWVLERIYILFAGCKVFTEGCIPYSTNENFTYVLINNGLETHDDTVDDDDLEENLFFFFCFLFPVTCEHPFDFTFIVRIRVPLRSQLLALESAQCGLL